MHLPASFLSRIPPPARRELYRFGRSKVSCGAINPGSPTDLPSPSHALAFVPFSCAFCQTTGRERVLNMPPALASQPTGLSRHRKAEIVLALHVNGVQYEHGKRKYFRTTVVLPHVLLQLRRPRPHQVMYAMLRERRLGLINWTSCCRRADDVQLLLSNIKSILHNHRVMAPTTPPAPLKPPWIEHGQLRKLNNNPALERYSCGCLVRVRSLRVLRIWAGHDALP